MASPSPTNRCCRTPRTDTRTHAACGSVARLSAAAGLSDGRTIERDFAAELSAPIGAVDGPLQDPTFFAQVRVDPEIETVVWPNGYDMDRDALIWRLDADGNLLAPSAPISAPNG